MDSRPIPMSIRIRSWRDQNQPDPQLASPLFSRIPAEIRNHIFDLAMAETSEPDDLEAYSGFRSLLTHDFDIRYGEASMTPKEEEGAKYDEPFEQGTESLPKPGWGPKYEPCVAGEFSWEDGSSGFRPRYPWQDAIWFRPGVTGRTFIPSCGLLRTCKRVYLETAHLPGSKTELVLYGQSRQPSLTPPWNRDMDDIVDSIPYQAAREIRSVHLVPQMWWLEGEWVSLVIEQSFNMSHAARGDHFAPPPPLPGRRRFSDADDEAGSGGEGEPSQPLVHRILDGVETLRITFRRSDWWWNESNDPLTIHPPFAATENDHHPFSSKSWGETTRYMPSLKRLEINFETSEDKLEELKGIVEMAREWKFPTTQEDNWLTTEGNAVGKMSWRGLPFNWSNRCPECGIGMGTHPHAHGGRHVGWNRDCRMCRRMVRLTSQGMGPRLHVWTVVWTLDRKRNMPQTSSSEGTGMEGEVVAREEAIVSEEEDSMFVVDNDKDGIEVIRGGGHSTWEAIFGRGERLVSPEIVKEVDRLRQAQVFL